MSPDLIQTKQVRPAPTAEEAAAIIAAVDLFVAETTPAAVAEPTSTPGWLRAALHEGTGSSDESAVW